MAVLEKIRKRAGVFISIFVGVALVLFIVDQNTIAYLFNDSSNDIAVIDKQKVDYNEYYDFQSIHQNFMHVGQNKSNLSDEENEYVKNLAWQDVLKKYILEPRFQKLGLRCSNDELEDLLYGSNISNIISGNFMNPETGVIDTLFIRNFFEQANVNPQYYVITEYWKAIVQDARLSSKYTNLVTKAFYVPTALAEMSYKEENNKCNFEYVFKPYRDISDDLVEITEDDYKKYYNQHQSMFKEKEQTRDLDYIVFNVLPSQMDTLNTYNKVVELREELISIEDNSYIEFAERQSDILFPNKFIDSTSIPPALIYSNFFNQEIGTTSNIYQQDDSYYFSRIVDEAIRPDSAMASHILISPNENRDIKRCREITDSLNNLLKAGASFEELAIENSDDPGSKSNGGDLGWFTDGVMVPEFNEACFAGKIGGIKTIETQFGIHIIKVVQQTKAYRKLKLASISKQIRPSVKTTDYFYSKASAFAIENSDEEKFEQAIEDGKLVKRVAVKVMAMDKVIPGTANAREIVQWAFGEKTKKGDVSHVFTLEDQFIVAKLAKISEKGVLPLEESKEKMQAILLRNKKAQMIIEDLNKTISGNTDLYSIASKLDTKLDTSFNISFNSFSMPGVGVEPNVNAVVSSLEENKISEPIKGNTGVFIVKVLSKQTAPEKSEFVEEQNSEARKLANYSYRLLEFIKEDAKIKDNRVKYF